MEKIRKPGLWLIAAYWFARSAIVVYALLLAHSNSDATLKAIRMTNAAGPFMWIFHVNSDLCLTIAPASVLVGIGTGIGVLTFQKWAIAIIALDRVFPLMRFVTFLPLLIAFDKGALTAINSSPLKLLDILFAGFMGVYFIRPDVRRLFGFS